MTYHDSNEDAKKITGRAQAVEQAVGIQADVTKELVESDAEAAAGALREQAVAAATEDVVEAQRRTRNTIAILSVAVLCMLLVGLTFAVFLLLRSNDIRDVQHRIDERVTQTERAFCAFMIQRALITITPSDRLLSNQAEILVRRFGCEHKLNQP